MARPCPTAAFAALAIAAAMPAAAQDPPTGLRSVTVNTIQTDQEFELVLVDGGDITGSNPRSVVIDVNRHRPVSNRWRVEFTLIERNVPLPYRFQRTYSFSVATDELPGSQTLPVQRNQWVDCTPQRVKEALDQSRAPRGRPDAVRYLMNIQDVEAKCSDKPDQARDLRIAECHFYLFLRSRDVDWLVPRGTLPLDARGCKNYRPRSFA